MSSLNRYKERLVAAARAKWAAFSSRERFIVAIGGLIAVLFPIFMVVSRVSEIFSDQALELATAESDFQESTTLLQRVVKLKARRDQIEQMYEKLSKSQNLDEGSRPLLERLVQEKAGVTSGFNIDAQNPTPFGGNFEKTNFKVRFDITDISRLVTFLVELANGPRQLILTRLDLRKSRAGDKIDVSLEVSSFQRNRQSSAATAPLTRRDDDEE